jgi:hypothetical protein
MAKCGCGAKEMAVHVMVGCLILKQITRRNTQEDRKTSSSQDSTTSAELDLLTQVVAAGGALLTFLKQKVLRASITQSSLIAAQP